MFKWVRATLARNGKGERVAYVVRWEPELQNVINPKRKKGEVDQRMLLVLFEMINGHTSWANPLMRADV